MMARALQALATLLALPTLVLLVILAGSDTPGDTFGLGGLGGLAFLIAALAFATVGGIVASRVPDDAVGWIFCVTGLALMAGDLAYQYADFALYHSDSPRAGGEIAACFQNLSIPPAFGLLGMALLLFPDGRLPSRRWRPALGLAGAGIALIVIGYALRPGPLDEPFESVENPLGVAGAFEPMDAASGLGWPLMGLSVALAAVALSQRLRRSTGIERQQLKWIALAAGVVGVTFLANVVSFLVGVTGIDELRIGLVALAFAGFPVAAGMAILRYRLFDVDVVINRTLVYGALTTTLAAVYLGGVLLFGLVLRPVTADSNLAIAGSTLAVAALFRPARSWIQEIVDRRFYRRNYNAARTLEGFVARMRDEVELESLSSELRGVVAETMQPAHVSLWLKTRAPS